MRYMPQGVRTEKYAAIARDTGARTETLPVSPVRLEVSHAVCCNYVVFMEVVAECSNYFHYFRHSLGRHIRSHYRDNENV